MRPHLPLVRPLRLAPAALLAATALAACAGSPEPAPGAAPEPPPPARAAAPMELAGRRVLVLPLQATAGVPAGRDSVGAELRRALEARDSRVEWTWPDELRRILERVPPGFAASPDALPVRGSLDRRRRRAGEPLMGSLRRYSALTEARIVVLPVEARFVPTAEGEGMIRVSALVIDARTGDWAWWGEADGPAAAAPDAGAIRGAAEALAARMVVAEPR